MQDFTSYAMGARVDGEIVLICPHCHKTAVKRGSTAPRFVHSAGMMEIEVVQNLQKSLARQIQDPKSFESRANTLIAAAIRKI